jgi:excisionase family DNA binding protein
MGAISSRLLLRFGQAAQVLLPDLLKETHLPQMEDTEQDDLYNAPTLADKIARHKGALTAKDLAELLNISRKTIFKVAKAGRIPNFRVGSAVRFDPRLVIDWLQKQGR